MTKTTGRVVRTKLGLTLVSEKTGEELLCPYHSAIVDGTAPADLTVTSLAKALPYSQTQQDARSHETPRLSEPVGKNGVQ